MGEHTKGPWHWYENPSGGCRVQTTGVGIADVLSRAGVVQESCAANARLIAAAPDLLEALEGLLAATGSSEGVAAVTVPCEEGCSICTAQISARAAITKARGAL